MIFFLFFTFSQSSSNEQQTRLSIQPHDRNISESYHLRVCFRSTFTLLFIYLFVTYFLSSLSLDKFLPNSFTTRIIVPWYPQYPSYEVYHLMTKNADRAAKFDGTSENSASRDSSILDVTRRSKTTLLHVARSRDYVCGFQTRYRWYFNEIITETGNVSVCVCVSQMLVSLKFQKPVSAIQISFRRRRFPPLDSKATLVPFFLFYYLFSFFFVGAVEKRVWKFLRERSSSAEILITRILSFVGRLLIDIDFLKRKIRKSSFFFYSFLYASCKRQFISIDWFRISAKEVHPHSLLYGSSRPSANATNCCKQPSST